MEVQKMLIVYTLIFGESKIMQCLRLKNWFRRINRSTDFAWSRQSCILEFSNKKGTNSPIDILKVENTFFQWIIGNDPNWRAYSLKTRRGSVSGIPNPHEFLDNAKPANLPIPRNWYGLVDSKKDLFGNLWIKIW